MSGIDWNEVHGSGKEYTPMSEESVDLMLRQAGNLKTALDIACGSGDLVAKLARRGLAVTGIDVSRIALDKAKQKLSDVGVNAALIEADFNVPDFDKKLSGPFNLVVIRLSLAFVDNKNTFLEKAKGLLAGDGVFICTTPVLLAGQVYDDRQRRISVNELELVEMLQKHFNSVSVLISDEVERPNWPLRTYLCR